MDTQESSSDLPILRQPKSRVDSARPAGPQEGAAAFWLQGVVLVARMMDRRILLVAALAQLLWQFQIGSLDNPAYSTTLLEQGVLPKSLPKQITPFALLGWPIMRELEV